MRSQIVTNPDRLRIPSTPVAFDAKTRLVANRLAAEARDRRRKALGLAAPQIGVRLRMFAYNLGDFPERGGLPRNGVVCNPEVVAVSDDTWDREEGCLSFPRQFSVATRPRTATIRWYTPDGSSHTTELDGMPCRVWLHEIDHLDGVLMFDRAAPGTVPLVAL